MPNRGLVPDPPKTSGIGLVLGVIFFLALFVSAFAVVAFGLFALAGIAITAKQAFAVAIGYALLRAEVTT